MSQITNFVNLSCCYLNNLDEFLGILEENLGHNSYLVGDSLTEADCSVFHNLSKNQDFIIKLQNNEVSANISRYYRFLESIEEVKSYTSNKPSLRASEKATKPEKSVSNVKFEDGGKFVGLKNATEGHVVVRFPPEASGFLHIGHAKAALINQHYKDFYKGKLLLRFDDTNPAKESAEFEKIILEDVNTLGITYDQLSYASDHFDKLISYCEQLIGSGKAYADLTDPDTMKKERELCQVSKYRDQNVADNLRLWEEMKIGSDIGIKCCIRIKLDMTSKNGCMRDPTIYRCKSENHVRTGSKYKVYPTYDFACPIVDSIEGVTHSLRTSEYNDRNDQFNAICDMVSLRRPEIADYSRLSLQNTVLSKRKLTWIVDNKHVEGWNDPRMPTVRGILRHGMTVEGLKEFVIAQGFGRANVVMEWDKIWAFNKKVIDPIAPRYTALSASSSDLVRVHIRDQHETVKGEVALHPKNSDIGSKDVWFTNNVLVERSDVNDFLIGANVTFINWGNLRIESIERNEAGEATGVEASLNLEDRDFKKTLKVTWLPLSGNDDVRTYNIPISVVTYGDLITKNILDKDDDFKIFMNPDSRKEECMLGDRQMSKLKKGDIIQIQRKGYFICDETYQENVETTGQEYPLVLINIPEGNKKERVITGLKQKSNVIKGDVDDSNVIKADKDANQKQKVDKLDKDTQKADKDAKKAAKDTQKAAKDAKKADNDVKKAAKDATKDNKEKTDDNLMKKQTRLTLESTREDNFSDWYIEVITKAKLISYYNVSGCYVIKPHACMIWEKITSFINEVIKGMGVNNALYPMFITEEALNREKDHIADFSPEVAWVTDVGDKKLEQRIAIRPTSETIMYQDYAKEIKSYRDLPLKINQWCNVVRWEFKNPVPFLRTREFYWQEGHTVYADQSDAIKEVYEILDMYAAVFENWLAVPVVKGRKTEKEKFAGADFTTTTEVYISGNGRAIQGATSHHLGQNFSKMFDIVYQSKNEESLNPYQNSWGMTTRTIGIAVMVHGDNQGLVLPPRVAWAQVVIIPCGITVKTSPEDCERLLTKCSEVYASLKRAGVLVEADLDIDYRSPGWKFNYWEQNGIPIRMEIGPKDLAQSQVVLCYRYNGMKETVLDSGLDALIPIKLNEVHDGMFARAKKDLDEHRIVAFNMDDLCRGLDQKMLVTAPFCGDKGCEDEIKVTSAQGVVVEEGAPSMGAKSLCIPLEQPHADLGTKCINAHCARAPKYFTMFGRSY